MERTEQRRIVESLVLGAPEPISVARLAALVPGATPAGVRQMVEELNREYGEQGRAFEIWEVAGGFQFRTLSEFAPYLQQIQTTRPLRLSQAALETLAIVAYRQPVTRAEIEHVRGVDVGAVLRSLLERKLVRLAGHREVPGRPLLYATARRFLEVFGLDRVEDLPTLRSLDELAPRDSEDEADAASSDEAPPQRSDGSVDPDASAVGLPSLEALQPIGEPH
jgi:segregation and condensation protein B